MILAIDTDNLLHLFESIKEACNCIEAIDIENNEYEFCDEIGQKYKPSILSPVTTFRAGTFTLKPIGEPDKNILISIITKSKSLDTVVDNINNLDELKKILKINV